MKTERFIQLRQKYLQPHFSRDNLKKLWRSKVKHQLRGREVRDLFDHYDFNYSILNRAETIRADVLDGDYRAQKPLVIKVEKKMGICRHLIIPQPSDALVLQAITEAIYSSIIESQPSKNSFYSRDRSSVKLPHEVLDDYSLDWFSQWRKMQKKILGFSQSKKLVISTDITNYFDSINLEALREEVLSRTSEQDKSKVLIDLLFGVIEDLSWRPDYLPYKKHGLPTINLESVRLLGHVFLFEVDDVLKHKTNENFTRWMDDITVGVDSREEASSILGGMSDVLKSSGLALNLAKTKLYTAQDYKYNFLIDQNSYLDTLQKKDSLTKNQLKNFRDSFSKLLMDREPQHWVKVAKRFITLHNKFNLKISEQRLIDLYTQYPLLRLHVCKHLEVIGFSQWSKRVIRGIVNNLETKDDVALYNVAELITNWNLPVSNDTERFVRDIYSKFNLVEPFQFFCVLCIKAKYDHPIDLLKFIDKYQNKWKREPFLRRQVTAVLSRTYRADSKKTEELLRHQAQSNDINTVSIANHVIDFINNKELEFGVRGYLFPKKLRSYSLSRFLVLCSVLNSDSVCEMSDVKKECKKFITDSYYCRWLDLTYNIR